MNRVALHSKPGGTATGGLAPSGALAPLGLAKWACGGSGFAAPTRDLRGRTGP
jgi:hypothetical protein